MHLLLVIIATGTSRAVRFQPRGRHPACAHARGIWARSSLLLGEHASRHIVEHVSGGGSVARTPHWPHWPHWEGSMRVQPTSDLDDLYCKLFVDTDLALCRLEALVTDTIHGVLHYPGLPGSYITGRYVEIEVANNAAFDQIRRYEPQRGYLFARYALDIFALHGQTPLAQTAIITRLLQRLRSVGMLAMPSEDLSDKLPNPEEMPGRRHGRG